MATKTKDLIIDSFLSLAAQDNIDVEKISITDIVDNCQISRQTFYYHFKDIEEMLTWAFSNEAKKVGSLSAEYTKWNEAIKLYKPFFNKYECFLKKCLNTKMFVQVYSLLYDSLYDFTKKFLVEQINCKYNDKTDFAVKTYVYALIGFIIKELKREKPDFDSLFNMVVEYTSK